MNIKKTQLVYDSFPYAYTHPNSLYALGTIMGLSPSMLAEARILEIGCASGGNIIPIAMQYPHADIVGVDISRQDIDVGQRHITSLGLTNIELKALSIEDFKNSKAKFDYIICHGVFSWVPEAVQQAILKVIKTQLSDNGLAYISYNTYPGWHGLDAFKHMVKYHTAAFDEVDKKIDQSYALFEFLQKGIANGDSPYAQMLKKEVEFIESHPPSYIEQEFLGENHVPLYFHEFIDKIQQHDLTYVADISLHSMYIEHFPEAVRESLQSLQHDIVRFEQYVDFILNRRFRRSVVCKEGSGSSINRKVVPDVVESLYVSSQLEPIKREGAVISYQREGGKDVFSTDNVIVSSMLQVLHEAKGKTLSVRDLADKTCFLMNSKEQEVIGDNVRGSLLRLYIGGFVSLYAEPLYHITKQVAKPCVLPFARYQATKQGWVTNCRHEKVEVGDFERKLLPLCDGTHTKEELVQAFIERFLSQDASEEDKQHFNQNKKEVEEQISGAVNETLQQFSINALLTKGI